MTRPIILYHLSMADGLRKDTSYGRSLLVQEALSNPFQMVVLIMTLSLMYKGWEI